MNKGSMDTKKKGLIGLGALVVLAGATILGSDPLYKAIDDMARPAIYTAGTYTASARGYGGPVTVTVKVSTKAIESIDVVGEKETLLDQVVPSLPDAIIGKQTLDMDAVSGATLSSNAMQSLKRWKRRLLKQEAKPRKKRQQRQRKQRLAGMTVHIPMNPLNSMTTDTRIR